MVTTLELLNQPYCRETTSDGKFLKYRQETIQTVVSNLIKEQKPKFCTTCIFDYCGCSVQDSILRCNESADFDTFGCINHTLKE